MSFNVRLENNILTFYNGVHEFFQVALSGEDTLKGTFPVFASDLWLVATKEGYSGEYYRTDAENYSLQIELVPGRITYEQSPVEFSSQYAIIRYIGSLEKTCIGATVKKTVFLSGLLQHQLVTVDS